MENPSPVSQDRLLHQTPQTRISNADLRLPYRYVRRDDNEYFEDPIGAPEGVWQPDVYPFAAALARRLGVTTIVDVGCGNGEKVAKLSVEFKTVGIDFESNVAVARQTNPHLAWIDHDLEGGIDLDGLDLRGALVICSDVIEHLKNPLSLLKFFRDSLPQISGIVISTPDRNRARGPANLGPPDNPAHTMEWSLDEFGSLLSSNGLRPMLHGFTRNFSESQTRKTQVAFVPGGGSGLLGPIARPSAIAYVPCYNEVDIIVSTVRRLVSQGIDVHVLDNWSTDGSWEALCESVAATNGVTLERFPTGPTDHYDWTGLLDRIDESGSSTDYEWILHVDADEQLDSVMPDMGVLDILGQAGAAGFDVIDATLIDFRPEIGKQGPASRWQFASRPGAKVIERAWKNRGCPVGISHSGGHALSSPKRVFPINFVLRHYPLRTPEQARRKIFEDRLDRFEVERKQKGWHVQYDEYRPDSSFLWDPEFLNDWEWDTPREWVVEFSTRTNLHFGHGPTPGLI